MNLNISLSSFAPENSVTRDAFGRPVSFSTLRLNTVLTHGIAPVLPSTVIFSFFLADTICLYVRLIITTCLDLARQLQQFFMPPHGQCMARQNQASNQPGHDGGRRAAHPTGIRNAIHAFVPQRGHVLSGSLEGSSCPSDLD